MPFPVGMRIGLQEPGEPDGEAGRFELHVRPVIERGSRPNPGGLAPGRRHLRGEGAGPHQLVDQVLVAVGHQFHHFLGRPPPVAGGPDGLVRLLGVGHLAGVPDGSGGQVVLAEPLRDLGAGCRQGGLGQGDAVGPHVGDVAVLVEGLGGPHGPARLEPQPGGGLSLEGRGAEGRLGFAGVGLAVHRPDPQPGALDRSCQSGRSVPVEKHDRGGFQVPTGVEVLAPGRTHAVNGHQLGLEVLTAAGDETGLHVPETRRPGTRSDGVPAPPAGAPPRSGPDRRRDPF